MLPLLASTIWRGALPTGICVVSLFVAVSTTPSVLAALSVTYSFEPSRDSAIPDGSQGPSLGPIPPVPGLTVQFEEVAASEPHSGIVAVGVVEIVPSALTL